MFLQALVPCARAYDVDPVTEGLPLLITPVVILLVNHGSR